MTEVKRQEKATIRAFALWKSVTAEAFRVVVLSRLKQENDVMKYFNYKNWNILYKNTPLHKSQKRLLENEL